MDLFTLILLAIGLSMDAFAVSICKGLAIKKIAFRHMLIVGAWFGCFQAIMPMIGYFLGIQFAKFVNAFAPWIAFILLLLIGINMIRESFSKEGKENIFNILSMNDENNVLAFGMGAVSKFVDENLDCRRVFGFRDVIYYIEHLDELNANKREIVNKYL